MPEIADDVAAIDEFLKNAPAEIQTRWRRVRAEVRRGRRISSQALPAMGIAAQHAALARDHAEKSLEAMSGIAVPPKDEDSGENT